MDEDTRSLISKGPSNVDHIAMLFKHRTNPAVACCSPECSVFFFAVQYRVPVEYEPLGIPPYLFIFLNRLTLYLGVFSSRAEKL